MVESTWGVPAENALLFLDIFNNLRIARRDNDEQMIYQNHQIEIWETSVMIDNAIATAKRQKLNKYNDLVDVLCRRFPDNDVRIRAMIVGVMRTVSASIKQTLPTFSLMRRHPGWFIISSRPSATINTNYGLYATKCTTDARISRTREREHGSRNAGGCGENTLSIART